jgi:hypothetical protein
MFFGTIANMLLKLYVYLYMYICVCVCVLWSNSIFWKEQTPQRSLCAAQYSTPYAVLSVSGRLLAHDRQDHAPTGLPELNWTDWQTNSHIWAIMFSQQCCSKSRCYGMLCHVTRARHSKVPRDCTAFNCVVSEHWAEVFAIPQVTCPATQHHIPKNVNFQNHK